MKIEQPESNSNDHNPGVYRITNLNNKKFYIGSSVDPLKRFNYEHIKDLIANIHANSYLQNAWNKENNPNIWMFEVIQHCPEDVLIETEQVWLDKYFDNQVNCYNILPVAGKSHLGAKRSIETKIKLSLASKGKPKSKQHINAMRKSKQDSLGIKIFQFSLTGEFIKEYPAIKAAVRETKIAAGSILSVLKNRRLMAGGFLWSKDKDSGKELADVYANKTKNYRLEPVDQYSLDGKFIKSFKNNKEASIELNLDPSSIVAICKGNTRDKTHGGFIWAFHGSEPRLLIPKNQRKPRPKESYKPHSEETKQKISNTKAKQRMLLYENK